MTDYTPTVEQARAAYTRAMRNAFIASSGEHDAEFDRMIAVVEAQALEQAADSIVRTSDGDDPKKYIVTSGDSGVRLISQHDYKQIRGFDKALSIVDWLRARAVEIREGRQ